MAEKREVDAKSAAIVAIDFEHDIVGADGAFAPLVHFELTLLAVIASAARLVGDARAAGVKIVYSTGAFQPGYPELVANIPVLRRVAELQCLVAGTAGAAIVEAVAPHDNDVVLTHPRVSCFHSTQLDV